MYSSTEEIIELLTREEDSSFQLPEEYENNIQHLIQKGLISEKKIAEVISKHSSLPCVDLENYTFPKNAHTLISEEVSKQYNAIPLDIKQGVLHVALVDPLDLTTSDTLSNLLDTPLKISITTPSALALASSTLYPSLHRPKIEILGINYKETEQEKNHYTIKTVYQFFTDALHLRASDIHIEPQENCFLLRLRVDGKLIKKGEYSKKSLPAIIARIKIMTSTMKVSEKRIPQDGRIQMKIDQHAIDARISTVPSHHGESIVIRLLNKSAMEFGLEENGLTYTDLSRLRKLINLPDGMVLLTGPTGSGKTTTLYSCLTEVNSPNKKIITIEDPVEYELAGVNQVMVRPDIGMSFAKVLRSVLRQAPNIIMIGEIRDQETVNITIKAALTGHLALSTLHTNDSTSAISRLLNMGAKRFLITSSLKAVIAQRLVRRLCDHCKKKTPIEKQKIIHKSLQRINQSDTTFIPQGCSACNYTGYKGRIGIFEILILNEELKHTINAGVSSSQLRNKARELGLVTLREDGIKKVLKGITSIDEILATTSEETF